MMNWIKLLLSVIAGYLIGSFSFSITLSRLLFGGDVRKEGSGNAGATNMARSYGILPGVITLLGDFMKAAAAMTIGSLLCGETGLAAAGISCLTGHCFPVYYGFKGGKGVSAGLAVAFAADWRIGLAALAVFAVVAFAGKKVSLASVSASVAAVLFSFFIALSTSRRVLLIYAAVLLILRHRTNIVRLLHHEEPDFKAGKRNGREKKT